MRIFHLAQHVNRVAVGAGPHRRDEIAKAVDGQQSGALKRRDIKRTGKVRAVMFDVMKLRTNTVLANAKGARYIILQVANFRRVSQSIFNLAKNSFVVATVAWSSSAEY